MPAQAASPQPAAALRLKQRGTDFLRRMGMLEPVDRLRLCWFAARNFRSNASFCRAHPEFVPPPLAVMHDAYGSVSYCLYWQGGKLLSGYLANLILKHCPRPNRILEWGCGPARILRHLPALLPDEAQFFGTDFNQRTIDWCQRTFRGPTFRTNDLSPPLSFPDRSFDVVFAVSVLTHLSLEQQHAWLQELCRILVPGGSLILTTHGQRFAKVLLPAEYADFQRAGYVVRSGVQEGKLRYLSFHHPRYAAARLFAGLEICEHITGCPVTDQDVWVLRNPAVFASIPIRTTQDFVSIPSQ